jgi:hypothetical protein
VLHALVEINAVVKLAAAFANEGQSHTVEESQAATDVGGGFAAREVAGLRRGVLDDSRRAPRRGHCTLLRGEIERQLPGGRVPVTVLARQSIPHSRSFRSTRLACGIDYDEAW